MYFISENQNAIKTVQRFLGETETGVYSKRTKDMVKRHQAENNLQESGIVDYETFTSLKEKYLKKYDYYTIFPHFPYKKYDSGAEIAILNALLAEIIKEYTFDGIPPSGEYYGENTVDAVIRLREIFMLKHSVEIDKELFFMLLAEKNAINLSKTNR